MSKPSSSYKDILIADPTLPRKTGSEIELAKKPPRIPLKNRFSPQSIALSLHEFVGFVEYTLSLRFSHFPDDRVCSVPAPKLYEKWLMLCKSLVYVMKVEERLSLDEYFEGPRFQNKKPSARKGRIYRVGDNIYYQGEKVERTVITKRKRNN